MISIIIAYYNSSPFLDNLERCLSSQKDCEVIIVDDASRPEEAAQLASYAQKNDWKVYTQKTNQGPGPARNRGIREASGDYIVFLDSDDTLHPQGAHLLHQITQRYHPEIITFGVTLKTTRYSRYYSTLPHVGEGWVDPSYAFAYVLSLTSGKCYCRRFLLDNDLHFGTMKRHEDTALTKSAFSLASHIYHFPHSLIHYNVHPNSLITSSEYASIESSFDAFRIISHSFYTHGDVHDTHRLEALEYVYISEVILSCAMKLRLVGLSRQEKKKLFQRFETDYPCWSKNTYLARSSMRYRLLAFLVHNRSIAGLALMDRIDTLARKLVGQS